MVMISGDNMMKYKDLIKKHTTKPTEQQIIDFVEYVSNAHSWYKHLYGIGDSSEFYLYINPVAGYARKRDHETKVLKFFIKEQGEKFFHYNEMHTELYQQKFASLTFSCNRGTRILYNTNQGISDSKLMSPAIHLLDNTQLEMPDEIASVARCFLNSTISKYMSLNWLLRSHRNAPTKLRRSWGRENLKLHKILYRIGKTGANFMTEHNSTEEERNLVQDYLREEQIRQKDKMKKVLEEVVRLSYK